MESILFIDLVSVEIRAGLAEPAVAWMLGRDSARGCCELSILRRCRVNDAESCLKVQIHGRG